MPYRIQDDPSLAATATSRANDTDGFNAGEATYFGSPIDNCSTSFKITNNATSSAYLLTAAHCAQPTTASTAHNGWIETGNYGSSISLGY